MPQKKRSIRKSLAARSANMRRKARSHRTLHWIGARALATLALGAALSIGGVTEALHSVRLPDLKELDSVKVVNPQKPLVWLAEAAPQIAEEAQPEQTQPKDVFHAEMQRINVAIRRQFFANAVPFGEIIHAKAQKYDVDPVLVAAVVETESRFRTNARSQVGARGLMQLMPSTGRWMGARNLYNAEQNVDAGAKYLKYLNARFDGNLTKTIAAYNAGEGNVRRYNGVPPFGETRSYVKKVMSRYEERTRELKQFGDEGR